MLFSYTVDTILRLILHFKFMIAPRFNTSIICFIKQVLRCFASKMVKFLADIQHQANAFIALCMENLQGVQGVQGVQVAAQEVTYTFYQQPNNSKQPMLLFLLL